MLFALELNGNVTRLNPSTVYAGSVGVDIIQCLAPYSAPTGLSIAFKLPNGTQTPYLPMMNKGYDENLKRTLYTYVLPDSVTQQIGTVYLSFQVVTTSAKVSATSFSANFTVSQSNLPEIPELGDITLDELYTLLLNYYNFNAQELSEFHSELLLQAGDIANLAVRIATNESDIATLQSEISEVQHALETVFMTDFSYNIDTGYATKFYNNGSSAMVYIGNGATATGGQYFTVATFSKATWSFVGGRYQIAFSPSTTGQNNANYGIFLDTLEGGGYVQILDSVYKGSDGSILLYANATFDGRVLFLNGNARGTQWFTGALLSGVGTVTSNDTTLLTKSTVGDYYLNNDLGIIYVQTAHTSTLTTWELVTKIAYVINGISTTNATFFAPITAGVKDYICVSNGGGAPVWKSVAALELITVDEMEAYAQPLDETLTELAGMSGNGFIKHADGHITLDDQSYVNTNQKGVADGVCDLDGIGKIPLSRIPPSILGSLVYGGTFNPTSTVAYLTDSAKSKLGTELNSITLSNNTNTITGYLANQGIYYKITVKGTFASISFDVGDWLLADSAGWAKQDNTDIIVTMNGALNPSPSFYAPENAGTANQILKSSGAGAPVWADGNLIGSIAKTATVGDVDTYTITYTNGTIFNYQITNGKSVVSAVIVGTEITFTLSDGSTIEAEVDTSDCIAVEEIGIEDFVLSKLIRQPNVTYIVYRGNVGLNTLHTIPRITHEYAVARDYQIIISGEGETAVCDWGDGSNQTFDFTEGIAVYELQGREKYIEVYLGTNMGASIGNGAFHGCYNLSYLSIPNSVTSIGKNAFNDCQRLTSLIIPSTVTSIEERVFSGCLNLTSIIIPNVVTSIGYEAFSDCRGLTTITFSNLRMHSSLLTSIGANAFYNCPALSSITIPSLVTSIGDYAFAECKQLHTIEFNGVYLPSIGENAFSNCRISDIIALTQTLANRLATVITNGGGTLLNGYRKLY